MGKNKLRVPISWKLEEYAFGVVALREELRNRKNKDKTRRKVLGEVRVRAVFIYAIIVTLLMTAGMFVMEFLRKVINKIRACA